MNTKGKTINLLIIGNKEWYEVFSSVLHNLDNDYTIEYISDINVAKQRLWRNSYDILLLEENFSKENTIDLTKMSYAMSRPSIIICDNKIKLWLYWIWKHFSDFTSKFITAKKLIYFLRIKR